MTSDLVGYDECDRGGRCGEPVPAEHGHRAVAEAADEPCHCDGGGERLDDRAEGGGGETELVLDVAAAGCQKRPTTSPQGDT